MWWYICNDPPKFSFTGCTFSYICKMLARVNGVTDMYRKAKANCV